MKRALVIGHTGGIGAAISSRLKTQGVAVTGLSRRDGFDLLDEDGVYAEMHALEPGFDYIFVATGILSAGAGPEKSLKELSAPELEEVFAVNCIGPALVLQHVPRLLTKSDRGVVAVLSARVGSIEDNKTGGWYAYRASKAALNQVIRSTSIELSRTHKKSICVALHPGTVATEFTKKYDRPNKLPPVQSATHLLNVVDSLTPAQTGSFYDWKGDRVPW
jgi:NAD(P)-dependent dehydrogenase (short-subunit alcohol dehydrogenase family)